MWLPPDDQPMRKIVFPTASYYEIGASLRGNGWTEEWCEVVKGKTWDDPEAELVDLRIQRDGQEPH